MASWTASLAESVGAQESGLRLILGQLSGYPIMLFYRAFIRNQPAIVQNLYFALTGVFMAWWAIGTDAVFHSSLCIFLTFAVVNLFKPGNFAAAAFLFVFNLGYLFIGYLFNATRNYDITWTMPQCVLCLRLIGLGMDVYDGGKMDAKATPYAIDKPPSIVECFGHSFFVGGYFVGPQFSMKKFRDFIERNIEDSGKAVGALPSPVAFGFQRCGVGILYLLAHLVGSKFVPEDWVMTDDFAATSFLQRSFWYTLWTKAILCKYIAAWLLAEGACIVSGLSYNGVDKNTGKVLWNGTANVKLRLFESCRKFNHLIESFNINTNAWVLMYVYKRLRFLNNRMLSQVGALAFLAIWHGYHSGYFITFLNEFVVMWFEKDFVALLDKSEKAQRVINHPVGSVVATAAGYLYVHFWLPHCFLPFVLLKWDKYGPVLFATNFLIYLVFPLWFFLRSPVKSFLLSGQKKEEKAKAQ